MARGDSPSTLNAKVMSGSQIWIEGVEEPEELVSENSCLIYLSNFIVIFSLAQCLWWHLFRAFVEKMRGKDENLKQVEAIGSRANEWNF
jgi:hypothetical protein